MAKLATAPVAHACAARPCHAVLPLPSFFFYTLLLLLDRCPPLSLPRLPLSHALAPIACDAAACAAAAAPSPRARPPARMPCAVACHGRAATSRANVCRSAPLASLSCSRPSSTISCYGHRDPLGSEIPLPVIIFDNQRLELTSLDSLKLMLSSFHRVPRVSALVPEPCRRRHAAARREPRARAPALGRRAPQLRPALLNPPMAAPSPATHRSAATRRRRPPPCTAPVDSTPPAALRRAKTTPR